MNNVEYLEQRNSLLVEIANEFHQKSLRACPYEYGGSVADIIEDVLVDILNGYAYDGNVAWMGLGKGYGFIEQ